MREKDMPAQGWSASGGKIYLGTDHAGFKLKEKLKKFLISSGYEVEDKGAFSFDKNDDYPDFVREVAIATANDPERSRGIVLGGSGQGEAMCANKIKGIRCAVFYGEQYPRRYFKKHIVKLAREHNDANILSLGARFLSFRKAKKAVKIFLNTKFSEDERHIRRIKKLEPSN